MSKQFTGILAALSLLCAGAPAYASVVVDTGPGLSPSGLILRGEPDILDWTQSWWAGKFTLTEATTVSSVEAWMSVHTGGMMRSGIYKASAGLPSHSPLYSIDYMLDGACCGSAWRGAYDLSWSLAAGDYWLTFEPPLDSEFQGSLRMHPADPLPLYAMNIRGQWEYDPYGRDGRDTFGVRISAVPEPATWAMMIMGFGLTGAALRRARETEEQPA